MHFSEELRRWFLEKEMDLFRFRFMKEGPQSVQKFLQVNQLDYTPVYKIYNCIMHA